MPLLHQVITERELRLLYLLQDRENVNRLLTLEATPEVLNAVLRSFFEQLARERNVNFRPSASQARKARTVNGEIVSPEFHYREWLEWFASQKGLVPKKAKKITVPKNKPIPKWVKRRIPQSTLEPNPAAPLGYRVVVLNGQQFIQAITEE